MTAKGRHCNEPYRQKSWFLPVPPIVLSYLADNLRYPLWLTGFSSYLKPAITPTDQWFSALNCASVFEKDLNGSSMKSGSPIDSCPRGIRHLVSSTHRKPIIPFSTAPPLCATAGGQPWVAAMFGYHRLENRGSLFPKLLIYLYRHGRAWPASIFGLHQLETGISYFQRISFIRLRGRAGSRIEQEKWQVNRVKWGILRAKAG